MAKPLLSLRTARFSDNPILGLAGGCMMVPSLPITRRLHDRGGGGLGRPSSPACGVQHRTGPLARGSVVFRRTAVADRARHAPRAGCPSVPWQTARLRPCRGRAERRAPKRARPGCGRVQDRRSLLTLQTGRRSARDRCDPADARAPARCKLVCFLLIHQRMGARASCLSHATERPNRHSAAGKILGRTMRHAPTSHNEDTGAVPGIHGRGLGLGLNRDRAGQRSDQTRRPPAARPRSRR